jgi:hypothetical protein
MKRQPHRAPGSMLRIATLLVLLGGMITAGTAQAQQPGTYLGDSPPRPPANIPNGLPPQPPPVQYGQQPQSQPPVRPPSGIQGQPLPPPPGATLAPQPPPGAQRPRNTPTPGAPAQQSAGQPQQGGQPQPADAAALPPPDDAIITEMPTQKIENVRAVFSGLDKITGRIISFDAAVGETVQFGALQVTARVCYTRPPTEATNTDAFVEVDEVTLQGEIKRIFNGWMFAASPGLHAVEHPIYDVWLTDCSSPVAAKVAEPAIQPTPAATTPAARPAPRQARQAVPKPPQPAAVAQPQ